jgi:hypothetical protein
MTTDLHKKITGRIFVAVGGVLGSSLVFDLFDYLWMIHEKGDLD